MKLHIRDLSDNEEGFHVYRQAVNGPGWQKVASLAAQSSAEWIEYSDSPAAGGYQYYVSSFNSQGEIDSNLAQLNVDPAECSTEASEAESQTLQIDLAAMLADSGADQAYCYYSLGGSHWGRWPVDGFLTPGDSSAPGASFNLSLANLNADGPAQSVDLMLECWGWTGGQVQHLGDFNHKFDLAEPGSLVEQAELSDYEGFASLQEQVAGVTYYPLGHEDEEGWSWELDWDIEPTMPYLNVSVSHDADECMAHLPPAAQSTGGKVLFCFPSPGFDAGPGAVNPQPYLIWNLKSNCQGGAGDPPCKPYSHWLDLANSQGGEVGFSISDKSSAGMYIWTVKADSMMMLNIPYRACVGLRSFQVQQYVILQDDVLIGPQSYSVDIDCPQPLPDEIPLDITVDSIWFGDISDGDPGVNQDIEVYGYIKFNPGAGQAVYLNLADWNSQPGSCPDEAVEYIGVLETGGTINCPKVVSVPGFMPPHAQNDLGGVGLCQGTSKFDCSISNWSQDNNTVRLHVAHGQPVNYEVMLYDWDDASANDLECWYTAGKGSRTLFEWAEVKGLQLGSQLTFRTDFEPDGEPSPCVINGTIDAALP